MLVHTRAPVMRANESWRRPVARSSSAVEVNGLGLPGREDHKIIAAGFTFEMEVIWRRPRSERSV